MAWLTTVAETLGASQNRKWRLLPPVIAGRADMPSRSQLEVLPRDRVGCSAFAPAYVADDSEPRREIYEAFDASQPVRDSATLFGRDEHLDRLLNGVLYRQNHGVISGPRAAGKTSLVKICAERARAEGVVVLYSSNDLGSSFGSLMRQLLEQVPDSSLQHGAAESFRRRVAELHPASTPQDVANLLSRIHYSTLVMIIDEFDRVPDEAFRSQMASLLKASSDARLRARFILVGDERTCSDILQGHPSLARHTSHISVSPLTDQAIADLLDCCALAAGLNFSPAARQMISDAVCGSPYHARLFGLHAALRAYADRSDIIRTQDAEAGLTEAFLEWESINPPDAEIFRRAVAGADAHDKAELMRLAEDLAWRRPSPRGDPSALAPHLAALKPAVMHGPVGPMLKDVTAAQFLIALIVSEKEPVSAAKRKEKIHP